VLHAQDAALGGANAVAAFEEGRIDGRIAITP